MFNVDDNQYFSSTANKYIKINFDNNSSDINYDKNVVIFGFTIAKKINRIFILPKFNCRKSLNFKKFINRNCSYDELFDVNSLDNNLLNYYRENVYIILFDIYKQQFLYHKLVPVDIKNSQKIISIEKVTSVNEVVNLLEKEESKVIILNIGKLNCENITEDSNILNGIKIRDSW